MQKNASRREGGGAGSRGWLSVRVASALYRPRKQSRHQARWMTTNDFIPHNFFFYLANEFLMFGGGEEEGQRTLKMDKPLSLLTSVG